MMAFSGQYAAARLDRLPLPHLVIGEISDYLGYTPNFAPPSYVRWAKMLGRLPSDDYAVERNFIVRAFDYELSTYRGLVNASCMRLRGANLDSLVSVAVTLEELRNASETHLLIYDVVIKVEYTREDFLFFTAWRVKNVGFEWPNTPCAPNVYIRERRFVVHRGIRRFIHNYVYFLNRYIAHSKSVSKIINRYNSALNVYRSFTSEDGTYDSDSD
jgi:hypothetical protein